MKTSSHSLWAKCRHILTSTTAAFIAFGSLSAQATGSTTVVISQIYAGGGNTSASYKNDFIELFNKTGAPINISGWTVQYASSAGTSWTITLLSGSIPANGYYLVQEATGGTPGSSLPTPDATGGINMAVAGGKVALVNNTTALTGNPASVTAPGIVDFVGWGSANTFETAAAPAASGNANSVLRANSGCQDNDNNSTDFTSTAVASPRNTASATHSCSAGAATQVRVETAIDGTGSVVSAQNVSAGSSITVYAIARDANSLFVANVAADSWSLLNKTAGVVDADFVVAGDSKSATFTGHTNGTAQIHVTSGALTSTDSGTLTVVAGSPTQVSIETQASGNGTVIGSQSVPTGNSLVARSIRRDQYGNFVDNVAADAWSLTGKTDGVVDGDLIADASLKFATFSGNNVGTAVIHVTSGALNADSGTITVAQVAPTITTPPVSGTTNSGANFTFRVTASGSQPFSYQWQQNGNNIANATQSFLSLNSVSNGNGGTYTVTVSNGVGSPATSTPATLTVNASGFSILTYNIYGDTYSDFSTNAPNMQAIGRQFVYLQPDIVCLQELPNNQNTNVANIAAAYLPGYYYATNAATDGFLRSTILSRWPLISSNSWLHASDLTPFGSPGNTFTRDLYEAKLLVPGFSKPLHIFTTHLKSGSDSTSCARRAAEAGAVSNYMYLFKQTNSDLVVLAGDFNYDVNRPTCDPDPTNNPALKIFTDATDLHLTTPVDPNQNSPTNDMTFSVVALPLAHRYDYIGPCGILYSNIASSQVFRTDTLNPLPPGLNQWDDTNSDHLPVIMTFSNPDTSSPSIVLNPANQSVNATGTAVFSVTAGGASPLSYRWQKGNVNLSNGASPSGSGATISGATTANLTIAGVLAADNGSYSVTITNSIGSTNTSPAVLTVIDPAIVTTPADQTNSVGATVIFSATGAGTGPLSYAWQKGNVTLANGGIISGSTTPALTLTGIATTDAGSYTFVASNNFGAVTSSFARLVVTVPATITTSPGNQNVNAGATLLLTGAASGSPSPTLHWERNGVTVTNCTGCSAGGFGISGATGSNLRITNVIAGDAGSYTFIASNSTGIATSTVAIVTVNDPFITSQPSDTGAALNGTAVFKVVAAGTAPITYQWKKNGSNLSDTGNISGSTTTNLTISSVSTSDAALYSVVVTGAGGSITSGSGQLSVTGSNGELLLTTNVYSQNFDGIGNSGTATLPPGWVMSPQSGGSFPTFAGGTNAVNLQASSGSPSTGGRYNWGDGNNPSDRAIGFMTSSSGYSSPNSVMFGFINTTGSNITSLTLTFNYERYRSNSAAAAITFLTSGDGTAWNASYPAGDCTYDTGASVYLFNAVQVSNRTVMMNGMNVPTNGTIYLRWNFNTTGGNSQGLGMDDFTLSATVATPANVPATITSQPTSQTVWQGTNVAFAVGATGTLPITYQWYKGSNPLTDKTNSSLTLASVTPGDNGSYTCVAHNNGGDTTSSAATLLVQTPEATTIGALRALVDNTTWLPTDTTTIYQVTGTVTTFTNSVTGNNTAFAMEDGTGGIWVFLQGAIVTINAGDSVTVTGPLSSFQGRLELSVASGNPTVGYSVLSSGNALPTVSAVSWTTLTNFTANDPLEGKRVAIGLVDMDMRTNTFATNSLLTVTNHDDPSQTFQVRIDAHCADFQDQPKPQYCYIVGTMDQATTTVPPTNNYRIVPTRFEDVVYYPPIVTAQPANTTVSYGGTAVISASAIGGHLQYSWTKDGNGLSDGGNVSGSQTASLTISSASSADVGTYQLTYLIGADISGGLSAYVNSSTATLTVTPAITSQPANTTAECGSSPVLSVTAVGTGTLTYQWYTPDTSGTAIPGATGASYTVSSASGVSPYAVVVTGSSGTATSSTATVTVQDTTPPVVTVTGANPDSVCLNSGVYSDAGATYTDTCDGSGAASASGPVDTTILGSYTRTYSFTDASGNTGTATRVVNVVDCNIAITVQPQNQLKQPQGTNVALTVTATGAGLTYQWYENNVLIPGATGATNSFVAHTNAITGTNLTYYVVVSNAVTSVQSSSALVTVLKDIIKPALIVTAPLNNTRAQSFTVKGKTTDTHGNDAKLKYFWTGITTPGTSPTYSIDISGVGIDPTKRDFTGSGFALTNPPSAGTNTLTIWVEDLAGNASSPAKVVKVFWQVPHTYALTISGDGTGSVKVSTKGAPQEVVAGAPTGTLVGSANTVYNMSLYAHQVYSIKYTPDPKLDHPTAGTSIASVVSNAVPVELAGTTTTRAQTVTFTAGDTDTSANVSFARNRFVDMAGTYNGVFTGLTNVASSRLFVMTISPTRTVSGYLMDATKTKTTFTAHQTLNADGSGTIVAGGITISGSLAWTGSEDPNGVKEFIGSATDGSWTAALTAEKADKTALPTEGFATMQIPGGFGGSGFATVHSKNGTITAIYTLADDDKHAVSFAMMGNRSKNIPQWITSTHSGGLLFGNLIVDDGLTNLSAPALSWIRPSGNLFYPALLPAGFTNSPFAAVCSPFLAGSKLNGTYTLNITGGGLANDITSQTVTFTDSKMTAAGKVKVGLMDPFGKLKFTFQDGTTPTHTTIAVGALLQNATNGVGFFIKPLGTDAGNVSLTPQ